MLVREYMRDGIVTSIAVDAPTSLVVLKPLKENR
jgi:hypothetical protein